MIKIPPYTSAIIFGSIGIPVFILISKVLEEKSANQITLII